MISENINIVKKYFEALSSGKFDELGQLLADDIIWHQPGQGQFSKTYHGKDELFSLFGRFMEVSLGTFQIDEVRAIMSNGDLVSAIIHFRASRDNKEISMEGVDLMRISNGKIQEVWLFSEDQEAEDNFWG